MKNIAGQIIGELSELSESIAQETANVPKDLVGSLIESGAKTKKQQGGNLPPAAKAPEGGALQDLNTTQDAEIKKAIARAALQQLAGKPGPREPSVRERIEQEEMQKKQMEKEREKHSMAPLPQTSSKRPRGMMGAKRKAHTEISKNAKND